MSIAEFFAEEADDQVVFKEDDYFEKTDDELKNKTEWIIPNAQKHGMEPILLRLAPGGSTCPDHPHEGEEFGYVFRGSVDIHLGSRVYRAKKGESFYFVSDRRHYLTSRQGAEILWISSPPSF